MSILHEVRTWLGSRYQNQLGIELCDAPQRGVAVWAVDGEVSASTTANLYDADLGLWIRFIEVNERETVRETVETSVFSALTLSSQLLHKTGLPTSDADPDGAWTISLIFLARRSYRQDWESAVQALRANSGFTEEVGIDVVFLEKDQSLDSQLAEGSFPQLMFHCRRLLRLPVSQLQTWSSADSEVAKLLSVLPERFKDATDRKLAELVVDRALGEQRPQPADQPKRAIDVVAIRNMRNVADFDLVLREPEAGVLTRIVHGPNGTGKSSIFEALSLALAGSSRRLYEYLADQDEGRSVSASTYVRRVLATLDSVEAPQVHADGVPVLDGLAPNAQEAERRLLDADGTLLAQEDARLFLGRSGVELGARVLRDYSQLARSVQRACQEEYQAANVQRQNWLRKFNINASVRRTDSRFRNLVGYFLAEDFPGSPLLAGWLQSVELRFPSLRAQAQSLGRAWSTVDDKRRRDQIADAIDRWQSFGDSEHCARVIEQWLDERELVLRKVDTLGSDIANQTTQLGAHRTEIEADLKEWLAWLQKANPASASTATPPEDDSMEKEVAQKLAELKAQGLALNEHLQHVQQVRERVLPGWTKKHPTECPTCGAEHASPGGIERVLADLAVNLDSQVVAARKQYGELLATAKALSQRRSTRGECPLTLERRVQLARILGTDDGELTKLEARLLTDSSFLPEVLRSIDMLLVPLTVPRAQNNAQAAKSIWDRVAAEDARGAALWELPDKWAAIRAAVDKECDGIVKQHLPQTLEAVWTELAMVMTPARWNLPDNPKMLSTSTRGADSLRLVVGQGERIVGVRHIFNQAESHVLGLAWFFTQYLAVGRGKVPVIALDDPAQEMDQTTFRAFLRLTQMMCRLHRRYAMPLTFLMFLHQEDRALDAARATSQQVTALRWAKRVSARHSVEQVILMSPDFKAPLPKQLRGESRLTGTVAGA